MIVGNPKVAHENEGGGTGDGDDTLEKQTKNFPRTNIKKPRGPIFALGGLFVLREIHICWSANSKGTEFIRMARQYWNPASQVHPVREGWTHM